MKDSTISTGDAPSFAELFTPKLVTVLHEGYGLLQFRADAIAGLTVAIVALPLSKGYIRQLLAAFSSRFLAGRDFRLVGLQARLLFL